CSEQGKIVHYYQSLENEEWPSAQRLSYPVEIKNHKAKHNLYYLIRYSKEYPYYNFYVKRYLLDSTGKEISHLLQGMYIFDEKSGEPKGSGWGNKYDYNVLSDSVMTFPYNGKYTIAVEQYMRKDTIQGISDF